METTSIVLSAFDEFLSVLIWGLVLGGSLLLLWLVIPSQHDVDDFFTSEVDEESSDIPPPSQPRPLSRPKGFGISKSHPFNQ